MVPDTISYCVSANMGASFPYAITVHLVSVPSCTGELQAVTLPRPSRPVSLYPHAHSVPSVLRASAWLLPMALTFDQVARVPTCTGEERCAVSPKPRLPYKFLPQHHRVPSV